MPDVERRFVSADFDIRDDDGSVRFRGHAAVFDTLTDIGDMFREQVVPGAFRRTIGPGRADVRFLFNHDPDSVMARSTNDTLRLSEDEKGLLAEAELDPSDADVRRLLPKLRAGNVSQMSFAFRTVDDDWDYEPEDGGTPIRTLQEVQLFDVSPVTFPAYPETDAALRTMARDAVAVATEHGIIENRCVDCVARRYQQGLTRSVISSHDTAVTEGEWDGPAVVADLPNDRGVLRYVHAWVDSEGDAEAKNSYKFPHHRSDGGPAILPGVRNALARLPQADIPENDRAGVERHLRRHLDAQEQDSSHGEDITQTDPDAPAPASEPGPASPRQELRRKRLEYLESTL